jgi:hypothetical protein
MEPIASYVAVVRRRRYDLAAYRDPRGYFLRVYDGRAADLVPPVHLDPRFYGQHANGVAWSEGEWRAWLKAGAEALLFRVRLLRLREAPLPGEDVAPNGHGEARTG